MNNSHNQNDNSGGYGGVSCFGDQELRQMQATADLALTGSQAHWYTMIGQQQGSVPLDDTFPSWHSLPMHTNTTANAMMMNTTAPQQQQQPPTSFPAQATNAQQQKSQSGHHPKPSFAELGIVCDEQHAHGLDEDFLEMMDSDLPALYSLSHHHCHSTTTRAPSHHNNNNDTGQRHRHPSQGNAPSHSHPHHLISMPNTNMINMMPAGQDSHTRPLHMINSPVMLRQPSPELNRLVMEGTTNHNLNVTAAAASATGTSNFFGTTGDCLAAKTSTVSGRSSPTQQIISDIHHSIANDMPKTKKRRRSHRTKVDCPYARYNNRLANLMHQVEQTKNKIPPPIASSHVSAAAATSLTDVQQPNGARRRKRQPQVMSASKALQRDCRKEHRMRLLQAEQEEKHQNAQKVGSA